MDHVNVCLKLPLREGQVQRFSPVTTGSSDASAVQRMCECDRSFKQISAKQRLRVGAASSSSGLKHSDASAAQQVHATLPPPKGEAKVDSKPGLGEAAV